MAFNFSPKIVTDGLVLYLDAANSKSYVSGSTSWNDISRSGNNGTLVNGPTYSSANGGSIVFDGINNLASITNLPNYNTEVGTINMWINPTTTSNGVIFQQYFNDLNRVRLTYGPDRITFFTGNITSSLLQFSSSANSTTVNNWTNVTSCYNFVNDTFSIYINGQLNASATSSTVNINASLGEITIGCLKDFDNPPPYYSSFFQGRISMVQIYNRNLNSIEILQNYNATKTRFGL